MEEKDQFSEAQISAAGRALADHNAKVCGVNKDDNWKVFGDQFIAEARLALAVAPMRLMLHSAPVEQPDELPITASTYGSLAECKAEQARRDDANLARLPQADDRQARIDSLEAARRAYASEFPLNSDGELDVGNIHANIRALKAQATEASAQAATDDVRLAAYDPNIRWSKQRVRLTLKQWDYSVTLETTVSGNCHGFDIFDAAISNVYGDLPVRWPDMAYVDMTRADGETLECEDDELKGDDWLAQMIVGIEIIGQEPERTTPAQAVTEGKP